MNLFAHPSGAEWTLFAVLLAAIGFFITAAEYLRKRFNGSPEITRKLVHILTGLLIFFAPELFVSGIPAVTLAVIFIVVNYAAIRFGLLKGMHGTNRQSYGTVYYPLSFLILVLLFWDGAPVIISISILILALSDAAAAIVGENLPSAHNYFLTSDKKSYEGSAAMFVTTAIIMSAAVWRENLPYDGLVVLQIVVSVSLFVTVWEAISSKGFDNLTIPLGAAFMIHYFFADHSHLDVHQMFLAVMLAGIIAVVSIRMRFLTPSGSLATFLLATVIYGIGGWKWTIPIFVFFIASSLLSKFKKSKKKKYDTVFDKSDKRDEGQVAANGGVAGIVVLLWYAMPEWTDLYYVYLSTIAAVTADTWGTEIGILGKGKPVSVISLKKVEPGTSGGVSLTGFAGGIIGSLLIVLSAWLIDPAGFTITSAGIIVIAGFAGSLVDSIAGATIQAQYWSAEGIVTERTHFHGTPTTLVSGLRWCDNDCVNWLCAVTGAICALALV
jgi:uncharacterized protein (TIGR00297 family)